MHQYPQRLTQWLPICLTLLGAPSCANKLNYFDESQIQQQGVAAGTPNAGNGANGAGADGGSGTQVTSCTSNCRIFVTSTTMASGNLGGISGADAICNADAAKPATGTYKAFLWASTRRACSTAYCSGGAAENLDWVLKPNTSYMRPDATPIGTTLSSGIFDLTTAANFSATNVTYLTGANATGGNEWTITAASNCLNWTSSNFANNTTVGQTAGFQLIKLDDSGTPACNDPTKYLLCVEQ